MCRVSEKYKDIVFFFSQNRVGIREKVRVIEREARMNKGRRVRESVREREDAALQHTGTHSNTLQHNVQKCNTM